MLEKIGKPTQIPNFRSILSWCTFSDAWIRSTSVLFQYWWLIQVVVSSYPQTFTFLSAIAQFFIISHFTFQLKKKSKGKKVITHKPQIPLPTLTFPFPPLYPSNPQSQPHKPPFLKPTLTIPVPVSHCRSISQYSFSNLSYTLIILTHTSLTHS